eukprot:Opistho-2@5450
MFTTDWRESSVHVESWGTLGEMAPGGWTFLPNFKALSDMLDHYAPKFNRVVAFVPTGWTHLFKANEDSNGVRYSVQQKGDNLLVYSVPYSEHSSYSELREFVGALRPVRIVATVVPSASAESASRRMAACFNDLVDARRVKSDFFARLGAPSMGQTGPVQSETSTAFVAAENDSGDAVCEPLCNETATPCVDADAPAADAKVTPAAGGKRPVSKRGKRKASAGSRDHIEAAVEGSSGGRRSKRGRTAVDEGDVSAMEGVVGVGSCKRDAEEDDSVECPICNARVKASSINQHIDVCVSQGNDTHVQASGSRCDKEGGTGGYDVAMVNAVPNKCASDVAHSVDEAAAADEAATDDGGVAQLGSLLPAGVATSHLRRLLAAADGSIERALNFYFDQQSQGELPNEAKAVPTAPTNRRAGKITPQKGSHSALSSPAKGKGGPKQPSITSFFRLGALSTPTKPESGGIDGGIMETASPFHRDSDVERKIPTTGTLHRSVDVNDVSANSSRDATTHASPFAAPPAPCGTVLASSSEAEDDAELMGLQVGVPVPYAFLSQTFARLEETNSRIAITAHLSDALRAIARANPPDVLPAVYLASNTLSAPFEGIDMGVGGSTVSQAVCEATGRSADGLRQDYEVTGDLGDAAELARAKVRTILKPKPLTVAGVFSTLRSMCGMRGQGSLASKKEAIKRLIVSSQGRETRYVVRTLVCNLRIGAVGKTLAVAVGHAFVPKDAPAAVRAHAASVVKRCIAVCPSWGELIPVLLGGGIGALERQCSVKLGVPVRPMLGRITRDLDEVVRRMEARDFAADFKFDGQRVQAHILSRGESGAGVRLFSRHLDDMTGRFPDVRAIIETAACPHVISAILDAEIIAAEWDATAESVGGTANDVIGRLRVLPFQRLTNRPRKEASVNNSSIVADMQSTTDAPRSTTDRSGGKVTPASVCVCAFDLMYLNGESFLDRPFAERRAAMADAFMDLQGRFMHVPHLDFASADTATPDAADATKARLSDFLQAAFDARCEGLMIKTLTIKPLASVHADVDDARDDDVDEYEDDEGRGVVGVGACAAGSASSAPPQAVGGVGDVRGAVLATYEPSVRSDNWLKVKRDYVEGIADSLDLVPIAGWYGNGRKAGWLSPFLMAAYEPDTGCFRSVCKCMSGFTDAFYKEMVRGWHFIVFTFSLFGAYFCRI